MVKKRKFFLKIVEFSFEVDDCEKEDLYNKHAENILWIWKLIVYKS